MAASIVIGLGNMGGAIAERIHRTEHQVWGVDSDRRRRAWWTAATGAPSAATLTDCPWDTVDRVVVAVRTTEQASTVLENVSELASAPVVCHVTTTLEHSYAARLGGINAERFQVLEQPVSGGAEAARAGGLTVLSAGDMDHASREFMTATVADRIVEFDQYGAPTLVKLLNNAVAYYNTRAMVTILDLAVELGLDAGVVKDVIDTSSGASMMGAMIDRFADDQAALLAKDMRLLKQVTESLPMVSGSAHGALVDDVRRCRDLLTRRVL